MTTVNIETLIYNDNCLGEMLEVLDTLHTAASESNLHTFTTMNKVELVGLLKDLIFTAQETIEEIETRTAAQHKHEAERAAGRGATGRNHGQNANPNELNALPANVVQFVPAEARTETRQAQ